MRLRRLAGGAIVRDENGSIARLPVGSMAELLRMRRSELADLLAGELPPTADGPSLPPVDGRTEIWASGVTYLRSRTARMEEASVPDVYDRVYEAERPELFFRAWHGGP